MTKNNQTIQQKMDTLRELTAWFDGDDFSLETAKDKFQEAYTLSREIEKDLTALKNDVVIMKESFEQKGE